MSATQRRAQQSRRDRRRHQLFYGVLAAAIIGAMAIALVVQRNSSSSSPPTTPQTYAVRITGEALPVYSDAGTDVAVGTTIPNVYGTTLGGQPASITNDGKAKVILFVAHWCPHCRREVPLLAPDLKANPLPANVELKTVSTGVNPSAPNYPPSKWLASESWPTPVIADDTNGTAAGAFGLSAYPYFVFVDSHNKVVARMTGEITLDQFHAAVASLR